MIGGRSRAAHRDGGNETPRDQQAMRATEEKFKVEKVKKVEKRK